MAALVISCSSGGGTQLPTAPGSTDLTGGTDHASQAQTTKALWGYYDLYFDFEAGTVEAVDNRSAMFTANVTDIMNGTPGSLLFNNLNVVVNANDIHVDLDVGLVHPLPLEAYRGYDVFGVFMGDGSGTLNYNGAAYPVNGVDQTLNNPDGYTRWFNQAEFGVSGLFGYTQGNLATPDATHTSNLNGYKFFADGLTELDDAGAFVMSMGGPGRNQFGEGETNFRHYDITFPTPEPNVVYGYAVIASWKGELPEDHPANTTEAVVISTAQTASLYYIDDLENGGNIIMDFSLAGYGSDPSTTNVEPTQIIIESSVLLSPVTYADPTTINTGGGPTYSTYSIDVVADNITTTLGAELWVIAEYDADYSNEFGVPNTAPGPLSAYFRVPLEVLPAPPCDGPEVTGMVPNFATNFAPIVGATISGTFTNGANLGAKLTKTGEADIVGTNVAYVDANTFTCDFDVTGAAIGFWNLVCTHDDCPTSTSLADAIELTDVAYDIIYDTTGPIGGGVNPPTPNGSYPVAIDVACRPNDGGFYCAWAFDTDSNSSSGAGGYIGRYDASGAAVNSQSLPMYLDPLYFKYGRVGLDCGSVGSSHGWALVCDPVVHFAGSEDMTTTNLTYGFWYGNPYWWVKDCANPGAGNVYSYANFNYFGTLYCTNWEHYTGGGGWLNSSCYYELWTVASNFDGRENQAAFFPIWRTKVMALTMGATRDELWNINMDAPHINRYSTWNWTSYSGVQFGSNGTADGEIAAWTDSGSPNYTRQTGAVDITTRHADNRIYALDEPTNGTFRIQAFDTTGTFLASSGEVPASNFGAAKVRRMDYNENADLIYVLLDDNSVVAYVDTTL
jgi:hypothetical protein